LVTKDSEEGFNKLQQFKYKSHLQNHENIIDDIKELKADVVINDILNTEENYIKQLKSNNLKVINFEDLGDGAEYADLVINALYSKSNEFKNTLWGHEYFCARDEFLLSKTKDTAKKVSNILITFGGTDPNNLTYKVLKNIYSYSCENNINIDVVLGLGYEDTSLLNDFKGISVYKDIKNMADFMEKADIIFTACGRTVYEAACIGTPCIVMAQNERELTHEFAREENGFINLGLGKDVDDSNLKEISINLIENYNEREKLHYNMLTKNLRKGSDRVINLILSTIERK
jgi:spore coat polysaccharide biosynthesis predicted glycosyltransferase SpsG